MLSLNVEKRADVVGGARLADLRKGGKMPAVYYGPKEPATPIVVDAKEFAKIWKKAGESSVVTLKDGAVLHEALIHEVDYHPVSGEPRHADFYVIEKGKKVEVSVQLSFVGVSPAVKDKGGILIKVLREVKIEAAPKDLPHEIAVDVSRLVELTDVIHAKDIALPKGVELKTSPEEVVASVTEAKEEVVEAPAAIDVSAIEVEAKGKEAKEGEAAEAGTEAKAPAEASKSAGGKKAEANK